MPARHSPGLERRYERSDAVSMPYRPPTAVYFTSYHTQESTSVYVCTLTARGGHRMIEIQVHPDPSFRAHGMTTERQGGLLVHPISQM